MDQRESNRKLIELIQQGIDTEKNYMQLYEDNHGFIYQVISKRVHDIHMIEDLWQSAFLALVQVVKRYDITRPLEESNFLQILKFCIWNELRDKDLPAHMAEKITKYNKTKNELYVSLNRKPSSREIALVMEIDLNELDNIKAARQLRYKLSLDEPIGEDGDTTRLDLFADSRADEEEDFDSRVDNLNLKEILQEALNRLPDREQEVIDKRYYKNMTLEQCGEQLSVSKERVRQIESKGFRKLRKDYKLERQLDGYINHYKSIGVSSFNRNHTSSVEWLVIKREKMRKQLESIGIIYE